MKEQLDVLGRNSIKDDNLEERPELRFQGFNENWKHEKIGELFDERSEKGYETLDLLSVTINNGVIKRKDIDAKDNSSANKSNYKKVLPNDIVYNSMRMWQGASGKSEFEGIVSPAYTILIPKNVDSDFIGYLFKKETTLYQFRKYSQGLTSDTWNLKYPLISQIKINVPDLKEQIKIRNFLRCVDKKIVFMQNKHKNKIIFKNEFFNNYVSNLQNNDCKKIKLDKFISIQNKRK